MAEQRQTLSQDYNLGQTSNYDAVQREFDHLHHRLDMLMLNRPIVQHGTNNLTYVPASPTYNNLVSAATTPNPPTTAIQNSDELHNMARKMAALNEELRVLRSISNDNNENKYSSDIAKLEAEIEELRNREKTADMVVINNENPILKGLKDYKYTVNFANNSTKISDSDIIEINKIASIVKENEQRITVVIRGFASNKGSAIYNNELSFNRTEAIKSILLKNGLSAKHILTLHHGIDYAQSEANAGRVVITLLVH